MHPYAAKEVRKFPSPELGDTGHKKEAVKIRKHPHHIPPC